LRDEDPHRRGLTSLAPFPAFALLSRIARRPLKSMEISGNLGGFLMSKRMITAVAATAVAAGLAMTQAASAQEVKVGVILPYTGVGAELAQQIDRGMELYLKLNADQVKPYTITLVKRDSKAPDGAAAKIAAQELLTQDKVDVLAGWVYSPDAIASAPVVNAGKKLAVIMNAATSFITNLSGDYVRTSFTMWHSSYALGAAAAKELHAKTAVVAYTDYPPGKDSLEAFKNAFEANGGHVIDAIPAGGPGAVPDFTPFFQRAKDEKPDVLFVFVPAGDHATAVVKTYGALGMAAAGIKLIGPGDIVQDIKLQGMGDAAVGLITMHHYNADLDNPQNKKFVAAWKAAYGADSTPDFTAVGGYDGMAAIVHAVQATKGKMDGDDAVKSLLGWKFNSPQGPIMIDPETRDIIMNEYLSEVVKGPDGKLHEKQLAVVDSVKDQCKVLALGPCAPKK
jgi:branched-chain amino acid transport system substrate-binding protein